MHAVMRGQGTTLEVFSLVLYNFLLDILGEKIWWKEERPRGPQIKYNAGTQNPNRDPIPEDIISLFIFSYIGLQCKPRI